METKIHVMRIHPDAILPAYGTDFSAGADLYACMEAPVTILPGEACLIHTGLAMAIPMNFAGLVFARSGLAAKQGLAPSNKVGVIDSDYRGEIMVSLYNHSKESRMVEPGERIAQIVITPYLKADWQVVDALSETDRGTGGFGSTGTGALPESSN